MANPIALAAAMARMVQVRCPHCGYRKAVERKPKAFRSCPRCHKHFPDPIADKKKRK